MPGRRAAHTPPAARSNLSDQTSLVPEKESSTVNLQNGQQIWILDLGVYLWNWSLWLTFECYLREIS